MAESKFSALFDNAPPAEPAPLERRDKAEIPARRPGTHAKEPVRHAGPGRPPGKSSNPEWEQTTIQLKRATKQAARAILLTLDGQDLSEVLQQLLEQWVKKQQKSQT
jgi:hypothetical protein